MALFWGIFLLWLYLKAEIASLATASCIGVNKCCCKTITSEWGQFSCSAHFWWQPTARQFFRFWLNIDIKVNNMSVDKSLLIIGCSSNWGGIWLLWWDICVVYNMKLIQHIAWPDGSPEPATLDKISIEPFPVIIQTGATITLDSQVLPQQFYRLPQRVRVVRFFIESGWASLIVIRKLNWEHWSVIFLLLLNAATFPHTKVTLNEEMAIGSRLSLSVQLEGAIPIKIPCLDIGGTNLGSWYIIFIRTVVCIFCSNQIESQDCSSGVCNLYIPFNHVCSLGGGQCWGINYTLI